MGTVESQATGEGRGSRVSRDAGESGAREDAAINVGTLSPLPRPGEMGRRAGRVLGSGLESEEGVLLLEPRMYVPIPWVREGSVECSLT